MCKFHVNKNTKIYIVAPANVATGGPELLHQLGYHLRNDLSLNAFMYYGKSDENSLVHPNYLHYDVPYVDIIEDRKENILIIPELYSNILMLNSYSKVQKSVWWLSVDFFYSSKFETVHPVKSFFLRLNNFINKKLGLFELIDIPSYTLSQCNSNLQDDAILDAVDLHLVQSKYAFEHLQSSKYENIALLSDYLNDDFLDITTDTSKKKNIVAYNPKKGALFTKKLIECAPDVTFIPIENMSLKQVIELLQQAKVYIDFGNHPGKDRIPREAAILKCCVITGKRGSAKYFEDVPIDNEFKFDDIESNIGDIKEKIYDIFQDYENNIIKFEDYIKTIKSEKDIFIKECRDIFKNDK